MQRYILTAKEVPSTLYRVQPVLYYVPPCASTKRGIYALNNNPKEPLGKTSLKEEVDNHLSIAKHWVPRKESQWPSPFLSVFATQEDAVAAAKGQREMLEEGQWLCFEISGAEIGARRAKVLRAKDVQGEINPFENQFLVWRFIPQEAIVTAQQLTVHEGEQPVLSIAGIRQLINIQMEQPSCKVLATVKAAKGRTPVSLIVKLLKCQKGSTKLKPYLITGQKKPALKMRRCIKFAGKGIMRTIGVTQRMSLRKPLTSIGRTGRHERRDKEGQGLNANKCHAPYSRRIAGTNLGGFGAAMACNDDSQDNKT